MSGLLLVFGLVFAAEIKIQTVQVFDAAPEDLALTSPKGIGIDKNGNLYILDGSIRTILVWDKDGKFVGNLGREGEGPGEIAMAKKVGNMTVTNNEIWVFDESSRRVSVWTLDRQFSRRMNYPSYIQRLNDISSFEDKLVFINSSVETGKQELLVVDRDLNIQKTLHSIKWEAYIKKEDGGYLTKPLATRIEMGVYGDVVFFAETRDNKITRINLRTGESLTTRAPLEPEDLDEEEKDVMFRRFKSWARPHDTIEFPEKGDTIFGVLPLSENKIVVLTEFEDTIGRIQGVVFLIKEQKVVGRFDQMVSPSLPRLNSLNKKVFGIVENEDGEIVPATLDFTISGSGEQP